MFLSPDKFWVRYPASRRSTLVSDAAHWRSGVFRFI
jgi:hypothetical protein